MAAEGRTGGKAKGKRKNRAKAKRGVNQSLVKSLTHELRVEILAILNERMASPNELAKELEEGLSQVSYHVKVLKDYGCIELMKTEPRRGAVEHYYRATTRAFLSDRDWNKLPRSSRVGLSADLLEAIVDDAVASLEEGTFEERTDRHMSWTPLILDEQGWADMTEALNGTLDRIAAIRSASGKRLAKTGEKGINASVSILGYEVPESVAKKLPKRKAARPKSKATKAKAKGKKR